MGCKVVLGDICSFSRGASIPRARMHDTGDYLYIHYGDLYKGFDLRIDVESPSKPIPFILRGEKVKESQCLKDQDIVYVLTSETVDDLGHVNICSFQGHCYCRRRPIALFDDYCGSRPPLLRIKATGC
ncbi:hypothetical protein [Bifidobacterium adolescentis]|uniref:hypothetical protein n=1 Tax=Bifidobacterium adolescentis TaxID=1680 RepID=UPI003219E639